MWCLSNPSLTEPFARVLRLFSQIPLWHIDLYGESTKLEQGLFLALRSSSLGGTQASIPLTLWASPHRMSHGWFFSQWTAECSWNMTLNIPQWSHWELSENLYRTISELSCWGARKLGHLFTNVYPWLLLVVFCSGTKFSCGQRTSYGRETLFPFGIIGDCWLVTSEVSCGVSIRHQHDPLQMLKRYIK